MTLTPEKVNSWVENKSYERINFFKLRKYKLLILSNGFRIRKRNFNNQQPFPPEIIGKYEDQGKTLNIKIQPSLLSSLIFGISWIIFPFFAVTMKVYVNGTMRPLDLGVRLNNLGITLLILIPITLYFIIWPIFKARKWIEFELKLTNRKKQNGCR